MHEDIDKQSTHKKHSFWEHHLEQWQQSGLSQRAYCHKHHLKTHQFYYWRRRKLKKQAPVSFLPVTLPTDPIRHPFTVRIIVPNGCSIELEGRDLSEQLERLVSIVAAL